MDNKLVTAGRRYRQELAVDVFTAARDRMRYTYENFDTVVISWSGGKDSSSCLEIARDAARETGKLPVKVMFLDEEVIYPETLELAYRHKADPDIDLHWVCVPSVYRNACSEVEPDFILFDPAKRDLWTHEPPPDAIWPAGFDDNGLPKMSPWRVPPSVPKTVISILFAQEGKRVASVTGLRTQESFVRYSGMMSSAGFITKPEKGVWGVRPIYDWKASDVWLAIKENAWDYNRAYDKLWRAGGNPNNTRVAPLFHAEAAMNLRQVMLYWPNFWQKVRYRVRGAHAVAIYNGALHAIERLGGETWQDAATRFLNGLGDEQDKVQMYELVQRKLDQHLKHAREPMPDEIVCSECNLSWKVLAKAVRRGDRQERMVERNKSLSIGVFAPKKEKHGKK